MSTQNVTHVLVHTRNKPHACSKCDKAFLNKSKLHTHELFHTGKKPHACSKCDKGDESIKLKRISAPKYVLQNSGLPLSSGQFPGDQKVHYCEGPLYSGFFEEILTIQGGDLELHKINSKYSGPSQ